MKIYKIVVIFVFFILIIIPIAFLDTEKNEVSEIDNSKLPEYTNFLQREKFEDYISKRIGFRNEIINVYTILNDKLFDEMVHPTYTYGKEGYVFFKTGKELHDDEYLDTFANMIKKMQDYTTQRGSYFLFVINPTKISVYRQYLPEGYNFSDYRINHLKEKLDELNVNYIDNTELLMEKSKTEQVFNVKYDAGHWNDVGAFYGINNIYKKFQEDGIEIDELRLDEYNIKMEKKDTLPVSHFPIEEEVPTYTLKKGAYKGVLKYTNKIELDEQHKYYLHHKNSELNNYTMLFFRGSYMNNREKFFSPKIEEVYYIHNYQNAINLDYYYNITKPDIVLFEAVGYAIKDGYYSQKTMKNKEYNKPYNTYEQLQTNNFAEINEQEIIDLVSENIKNNEALTKIKLEKSICKYAYLQINDNIYDFICNPNGNFITLDTDVLKGGFNIILISDDLQYKQINIINLKKEYN